MTAEEIDTVLERHSTGVLALASEDEPYAIPVSYGYDDTDRKLLFRLVFSSESVKRRFVSDTSRATLVVYEERENTYRSVVALGTLEKLPFEDRTVEHKKSFRGVQRPLFELWGRTRIEADIPPPDLDIEIYELDPDELNGHRIELQSFRSR